MPNHIIQYFFTLGSEFGILHGIGVTEKIDKLWTRLLFTTYHDIIPYATQLPEG